MSLTSKNMDSIEPKETLSSSPKTALSTQQEPSSTRREALSTEQETLNIKEEPLTPPPLSLGTKKGSPSTKQKSTQKKLKNAKPNVIVIKREALKTKKAVELLLSGTLKNKVCRYCLHITYPLSDLDQIMQIGAREALYKVTIRDIVASFHPFQVADDPNFPNKICEKCLNQAIRSYLFAQQCEQSERALRNCLDDMYEKLEKLDPLERQHKRGRHKQNPNHNVLRAEHQKVIEYAEPIRHLVNVGSVSYSKEPKVSELECIRCWQVLPSVEALVNHEKIHPKSMWYHCRLCGKSMARKFQMKRHLRIHAKGKAAVIVNESGFVCKQCGAANEDYNVHLQHIEKHKFRMVMEHLVERKIDRLCSICLNKSGNMVEMDKIIRLHGGYPELTGERTMYNILGSTVPERNYKYQEFYTLNQPKIVMITKKVDKNPIGSAGSKKYEFNFEMPSIIAVKEENSLERYRFILSEPQKSAEITHEVDQNMDEDIDINTLDVEVPKIFKYDGNMIVEKQPVKDVLLLENNNIVVGHETKNQFKFSEPDYQIDVEDIYQEKVVPENNKSIGKLCSACWVFNKPMCNTCTAKGDAGIQCKNGKNAEENTKCKPCQYCWVFKKVGYCNFCKQPSKETVTSVKMTLKTEDFNKSISPIKTFGESPESVILKKRKIVAKTPIAPKKTKWHCNICLIANVDRETCYCCESDKDYKDSTKLNFNLKNVNFLDFVKTATPNIEDIVDIGDNNNTKVIETKTELNLDKTVAKHDNLENIEKGLIEMMEASNSPPLIITENYKIVENMDVVCEEENLNASVVPALPNVIPTPILSNPFPYALAPLLFHPDSSLQTNPLQFTIGSMPFADRPKNIRKLKRPLRRQSSTLHK